MTLDRRAVLAGLGLAGLSSVPPAGAGPEWPSQLIRIVVPFTPGGSTDVLARLIAGKLDQAIAGKGFVIENRPGAGGMTAAGQVARADPDGHSLMMGHIGTLAFAPSLYANVPYDPIRSFQPVALVAMVPNILAINPKLPAKTFAEFVAYGKANPGKLNYSSGGQGSAAHIASAYLSYRTGIEAVHVPYRGTAPSVNDLVAGNVQFTLTGGPAVLPLTEGGQLRVLGVASRDRAGFAPDLPTLSESGLTDFEAVQWYGVVAPAGTPMPIVERLNHAINGLLDQPDFAAALARDGAIARPETPDGFGELIASELALWREVIARAGIKAAG